MIRIRLPQAEVEQLQQVFRSTEDRKLRDRVQVLLLAHRGRKHQDIAADLCINRRGVQRWLNAYLDPGLDGLLPRKAKGADGNIPAEMVDEIKRWVIEGPAKQGLERANWTHAERADHLLLIDNAPWHRGKPIDEAMAENAHLEFKRLPRYSPQLNPIERFGKVLRRRARHNRLFDAVADLKKSVRVSLSYFQTVRQRVLTLINGRRKKSSK